MPDDRLMRCRESSRCDCGALFGTPHVARCYWEQPETKAAVRQAAAALAARLDGQIIARLTRLDGHPDYSGVFDDLTETPWGV